MALFKLVSFEKDNEIAKTMATCFQEPLVTVNFFLNNKSEKSKCYNCIRNNEVISLLHSIPYKIKLGKSCFNCSYLYGACTVPKYRKKGYMSKLIKFYEMQSKLNGFDFSALVPDNKHLENYYQKLGYENFFKIKEVNLNKKQFLKLCSFKEKIPNQKNKNNFKFFYKYMEKLRLNIYNDISNILYNSQDIKYASDLYKFFGGKFINLKQGYGICVPIDRNTVEIKDITCKIEFIPDLLGKIYMNFPYYENFKILTNPNDTFFKKNSKIYYRGMIKPLSSIGKQAIEEFILTKNHEAYLGLALD